jgi:hypothetical protein
MTNLGKFSVFYSKECFARYVNIIYIYINVRNFADCFTTKEQYIPVDDSINYHSISDSTLIILSKNVRVLIFRREPLFSRGTRCQFKADTVQRKLGAILYQARAHARTRNNFNVIQLKFKVYYTH